MLRQLYQWNLFSSRPLELIKRLLIKERRLNKCTKTCLNTNICYFQIHRTKTTDALDFIVLLVCVKTRHKEKQRDVLTPNYF